MIAPDDLSLTDAEVLETLARGELELLGLLPRSSNYTFLARVRTGVDELLAVYKPQVGEAPLWDFPDGTLFRREVAAYVVATALGWPRIPPTLERDGPHGVGSVQRFLPFDPEHHYFTMQDDPRHLATFRRVALFDEVVNNADRKSGHCLLAEDGDLFFVDHGVCFSVEPKLRTVIWAFAGEPITPAEGDDLRSFRAALEQDRVRDRLASLLSPAEVGAVVGRVDTLLGTGRLPRPGPERPYPWPPV
ncbi:MAG TPA: SCO1664 family protein [Actinomycetota bacterium]|nr:SCO1664 family protein [Actinomycetota bacterium]